MGQDGDYPFYVKVRNRFIIEENRPEIKVRHYYYPHGEGPDTHDEDPSGTSHYTIIPGAALSFPLHWRKEYLEITILGDTSNINNENYYVWCGTEALCQLIDNANNEEKLPDVPSLIKRKTPSSDGKYNVGGGWKFSKGDDDFTLTIRKRTDDPEEENVTIGENPPT
jgi:hypothetical protein